MNLPFARFSADSRGDVGRYAVGGSIGRFHSNDERPHLPPSTCLRADDVDPMASMEDAEAMIEQDGGEPDDTVTVSRHVGDRRTYHEPGCHDYSTVREITRREAHRKLLVPCRRCVLSD